MSAMVEVLLLAVAAACAVLVAGGVVVYVACELIDSMLEDSEE